MCACSRLCLWALRNNCRAMDSHSQTQSWNTLQHTQHPAGLLCCHTVPSMWQPGRGQAKPCCQASKQAEDC